jgi:hypothetical protein
MQPYNSFIKKNLIMKKYLLIFIVSVFSVIAYAQPASDWPPVQTTGVTQAFNIAAINLTAIISNGDEVAIFARVGGVTYNLGKRTIAQIGTSSFGAADFSGATILHLGTGGVTTADAVFFIQIYDTDNSGGGATPANRYYELTLSSPAPTIGSGSYNANGKTISPSSPSVLPVELTSFTGAFSNNAVTLNWATASEENNDYFTVERSNNGKTFDALDNISGAGTTVEAQEYTYTDEKPESGVNYYRLKQTDFDEKFTYSKVIAVETNKEELEIKIYPNPVSSVANIVLPAFDGDTKISVMDVSGREVLSQQVSDINEEAIQLDLSQLQSGLYIITVTNGSQVISKQIQLTK